MTVAKRLRPWIRLAALIVILGEVLALALMLLVGLPAVSAQYVNFGASLPWTTIWLMKVPFMEASMTVLLGGALLGAFCGRSKAAEIVFIVVALGGFFAVEVAVSALLLASAFGSGLLQ